MSSGSVVSAPVDRLITALSKPPASFAWSASDGALIGAAQGIVIQVLPHKIECMAVMAYDAPVLAQNNATLMLFALTALRPDWNAAGDWLAQQMKQAAQSVKRAYAGPNADQGCCFEYDKQHSRATLTIKRD